MRERKSASALSRITLHALELQPAFARGVGKLLNAAVVLPAATVEDHSRNALLLRTLGDHRADDLGRIDVAAALLATPEGGVDSGGRRQRVAVLIVDDLDIDILGAAKNVQAGPLGGTGDLIAHAA